MTAGQLSGKNEVHPRTPGPRLTHQLSADVWVRHAKMGQAWPRSSEPPSIPIDISVSHSVMSDSLQPHGLYISLMHAILQARILEWVAISFSNAWKWKVKGKLLSHVWLFVTPWTAAHQAPLSMGFSRQEYWSGVPLPSPTHYERNANQNHNEISPHTSENGHH